LAIAFDLALRIVFGAEVFFPTLVSLNSLQTFFDFEIIIEVEAGINIGV